MEGFCSQDRGTNPWRPRGAKKGIVLSRGTVGGEATSGQRLLRGVHPERSAAKPKGSGQAWRRARHGAWTACHPLRVLSHSPKRRHSGYVLGGALHLSLFFFNRKVSCSRCSVVLLFLSYVEWWGWRDAQEKLHHPFPQSQKLLQL